MMRPRPGWMTAMSSSVSSRWPLHTAMSFNVFSSAMRKAPSVRRHNGRLPGAQAHRGEGEQQRRGLREREPAAGDQVGGGRVAQRLERGAEAPEADATAPRDGTGHARAPRQKQAEQQVADGRVELERMAGRGPEPREDDAPRERRRPSVAAAREKAADAADGERQEARRNDGVEQLAGGSVRHPRDDDRRAEPGRDAARRREPTRAAPVRLLVPVRVARRRKAEELALPRGRPLEEALERRLLARARTGAEAHPVRVLRPEDDVEGETGACRCPEGRAAVERAHRVEEDGAGRGGHRYFLLVEDGELIPVAHARDERGGLACLLLRDDAGGTQLLGDVAQVDDRPGLPERALVAGVDEGVVHEVYVEPLLVVADPGVLPPENRLRQEDLSRPDDALGEGGELRVSGEVVESVADEGKLPPAAHLRIALRRRPILVVGRKVTADVRLSRRELRSAQELRNDDVAVSAPVSEMFVRDPHDRPCLLLGQPGPGGAMLFLHSQLDRPSSA